MSNLAMPTAIISMAQQASPKVMGQRDMARQISKRFWASCMLTIAGSMVPSALFNVFDGAT
jgi:hypothetical protein